MDTYVNHLIDTYRHKPIVIDANLLTVLCTGEYNIDFVGKHNRTDGYISSEFELLKAIVLQFKHILTLPNILTEVTNLITLNGRTRDEFSSFFVEYIKSTTEIYLTSEQCFYERAFSRLGLTDAGIINLSVQGFLVISVDLDLCLSIQRSGRDVINFNNIRKLVW